MEFRDYIEAAAKSAGSQTLLCEKIGITTDSLTHAKAGRRGLPEKACFQLAEILNKDPKVIIAARERMLAKTEEDRAFWKKVAAFAAVAITIGTAPHDDARANDTLDVSQSAGNAHPTDVSPAGNVYYVNYRLKRAMQKVLAAIGRILGGLPRFGFAG